MKTGAKQTGEDWRDSYGTPPYILKAVAQLCDYWADPCPPSPHFDGLGREWDEYWDFVFVNPPFSQYAKWVDHGMKQDCDQVWLSHTNNDTQWFQKLASKASALCLLNKRVKFIDPRTGVETTSTFINKGQCIHYIGNDLEGFNRAFSPLGNVLLYQKSPLKKPPPLGASE